MTAVDDDRASVAQSKAARGLVYRLSAFAKMAVAVLLALTPFTAFLVLGWLVRLMRREAVITAVRNRCGVTRPNALSVMLAEPELSGFVHFPGWWTGLWRTVLDGARAVAVSAALVLPFGLLLLFSWWAGWENSFNKGYEQAWVGPLLGLVGAGLALVILVHMPMAFAHFAAEGQSESRVRCCHGPAPDPGRPMALSAADAGNGSSICSAVYGADPADLHGEDKPIADRCRRKDGRPDCLSVAFGSHRLPRRGLGLCAQVDGAPLR